jgi:hypothetical protein
MIDQLCQGYHWSFQEAMSLTLPQVILLGHAAWANDKRMKARSESPDTKVVVGNKEKSFEQMDSKDYEEYYGRW